MRVGWLVLVALAGCGYPEDTFQEDYLTAYCSWAADCQLYADEATCSDAYADWQPGGDGEYDAKAAKDCVTALEDQGCPSGEEPVDFPDACSYVYGGAPEADE